MSDKDIEVELMRRLSENPMVSESEIRRELGLPDADAKTKTGQPADQSPNTTHTTSTAIRGISTRVRPRDLIDTTPGLSRVGFG